MIDIILLYKQKLIIVCFLRQVSSYSFIAVTVSYEGQYLRLINIWPPLTRSSIFLYLPPDSLLNWTSVFLKKEK